MSAPTSEPDIVCKVTSWFYRRMGLMILMFVAFAAWFLYDGMVGWPKKNKIADAWDEFREMNDEYDKFELDSLEGNALEDKQAEWLTFATEKGYPILEDGTPPKWSKYGAGVDLTGPAQEAWEARGKKAWGEKEPKRHTEDDIAGQYRWATGCGVIGLLIAGYTLLNRGKKIKADNEAYYTDKGERIPFDAIFRVDKRKWDNKGLAYFTYREGEGDDASETKVPLDDLKYGGADKILDRVLENFEGELIETIPDEEDEEEEEDSDEKNEEIAAS